MCVVIDTNVFAAFVANSPEPGVGGPRPLPPESFTLLGEWLLEPGGDGHLAWGGSRLRAEQQGARVLNLIQQLKRVKRLVEVADAAVDDLQAKIDAVTGTATHRCKSDDPHIVALMILSGARVVVTRDKTGTRSGGHSLADDIKNTDLVNPKGKVFPLRGTVAMQRAALRTAPPCPRR